MERTNAIVIEKQVVSLGTFAAPDHCCKFLFLTGAGDDFPQVSRFASIALGVAAVLAGSHFLRQSGIIDEGESAPCPPNQPKRRVNLPACA
jgi:hypothetical protein